MEVAYFLIMVCVDLKTGTFEEDPVAYYTDMLYCEERQNLNHGISQQGDITCKAYCIEEKIK